VLNRAGLVLRAVAPARDAERVPDRLRRGARVLRAGPPLITSMFLHGKLVARSSATCGYLWIFGDNVEDRVGHGRFILFYLLCGHRRGARPGRGRSQLEPCRPIGRQRRDRRRDGRLLRALPALAACLTLIPWILPTESSSCRRSSLLGFWVRDAAVQRRHHCDDHELAGAAAVAFAAHIVGFSGGDGWGLRVPQRRDLDPWDRARTSDDGRVRAAPRGQDLARIWAEMRAAISTSSFSRSASVLIRAASSPCAP